MPIAWAYVSAGRPRWPRSASPLLALLLVGRLFLLQLLALLWPHLHVPGVGGRLRTQRRLATALLLLLGRRARAPPGVRGDAARLGLLLVDALLGVTAVGLAAALLVGRHACVRVVVAMPARVAVHTRVVLVRSQLKLLGDEAPGANREVHADPIRREADDTAGRVLRDILILAEPEHLLPDAEAESRGLHRLGRAGQRLVQVRVGLWLQHRHASLRERSPSGPIPDVRELHVRRVEELVAYGGVGEGHAVPRQVVLPV
mmetsp:Transcript_88741/g.228907  ORF Transcript_88741/g.228907 Transcript_88741/m.228907 type:complete len:259 (-) Transcript_88741:671-1447(-)